MRSSESPGLWLQEGSLEGSSSGSGHKEDSKQLPGKTQVVQPLVTLSAVSMSCKKYHTKARKVTNC